MHPTAKSIYRRKAFEGAGEDSVARVGCWGQEGLSRTGVEVGVGWVVHGLRCGVVFTLRTFPP